VLAAPALAGVVDADASVSAGSWGGPPTLLVAYHRELRDTRIRAALPIAAPACFVTPAFFGTARVPMLLLYGETDAIVPFAESGKRAFRASRGRSQLVVLAEASHTGFSAFTAALPPAPHYDALACRSSAGWNDLIDEPFRDLVARRRRGGERRSPFAPCAPDVIASLLERSMQGARQQALVRPSRPPSSMPDCATTRARCVRARLRSQDDVTVRGR
jgi:hypothetical protein